MKNKYYALFNPKKFLSTDGLIFNSWSQCKQALGKEKQSHFKSFTTKVQALSYLDSLKRGYINNLKNKDNSFGKIYTDGSYNPLFPYASWAWVFIKDDKLAKQSSGLCKTISDTHQVAGELEAVLQAGSWCARENIQVVLHYDYEGIWSWALGSWEAKDKVSQHYREEVKKYLSFISFEKVKAHSDNKWNEVVDGLAKIVIEKEMSKKIIIKKTLKKKLN